jgi:two-component system, sensor histidine kinase ChiS
MMKLVKQLIKKVLGDTESRSFEQTLFIGMIIFGIFESILMTISNIFNKDHIDTLITLSILIFCTNAYYFARYKKKYFLMSTFLLTAFVDYVAYFNTGGINGPIPYILILLLAFVLIYSPLKRHFGIFVFLATGMFIIFFIEYLFPQLVISPYKTQNILNTQLLVVIIVSMCLFFVSIYFLRKSYDNERIKNQLQKELLEKAAYQKSMFFINISHEIKTPLTLVENYLDKYIERWGEDDELVIMRQNIQKMRRDILDYLNFENLERGRVSYDKPEVFSLSKFIEEKIVLFISYAKNKGILLNHNITPDIYVKINLKGIEQVLNNLLENAVKYTPERGEININLKSDENYVEFIVQNNGVVIPSEQIPHLFEPFYQLSQEKYNTQGMGMGLYIVKKILDITGGQIQVDSSKEQGVVFRVQLPFCKEKRTNEHLVSSSIVPNINPIMPKALDSAYSVKKQCLLIAEDQNDLLSYLVGELNENYNVFVADNGLAALERLESMPIPELIISDIMMDKMDGYELLEKTLADERFSFIPFIFLTAKDTTEEKVAGLDLGALDFITKPFSIDELKMKIKTIINQKTRISEAAIREVKKQFADTYSLNNKKKFEDIFNLNALKYNLTVREKEIISYIRKGSKYEEIAEILYISDHTVNRHVQNIYKKTDSTTKIGLINKMYKDV